MSALQKNVAILMYVGTVLLLTLLFAQSAYAVSNIAQATDSMCITMCAAAAAKNQPCPKPTVILCGESVGGSVTGICQPTGCQALSASGLGGGNSLSSMSQLLGQVLGKLMSLGQSSGSGSSASPTTTGTTCASYTPTSDPTQIGINPCVYYVPSSTCTDSTATNYNQAGACIYGSNSGTNTSAQDLLNALNGTSGTSTASAGLTASPASGSYPLQVSFSTTPISGSNTYTLTPGDGGGSISLTSSDCASGTSSCVFTGTYTYEAAGTYTATVMDQNDNTVASAQISVLNPNASAQTSTSLTQVLNSVGGLLAGTTSTQTQGETSSNFPGVLGNILLSGNGATIFASTINSSNNSETSGFYGSDTLSGQSQGIASQMCQGRPWASNFLADIIPPSFFDSLCQWGGYQVGQPQQAQTQVTLTQQAQTSAAPATVATTTAATSTSNVAPQAVIWAVPSAVPLGARTSIYWNSQGVTSCSESSPDGNFTENSLSGAAATVPITADTTFTISCLDPNGNPITDYVMVSISS